MSCAYIKFVKIDPNATLPRKATSGTALDYQDAAFDLFPSIVTTLIPGERALVPTGLAAIIPVGYWVKFHERSGLASKSGIHILGGVIDNTYLGEWKIVMYNSSSSTLSITPEKAVSQFTLEKLHVAKVTEISREEFEKEFQVRSDSRKANGFGSTDKK